MPWTQEPHTCSSLRGGAGPHICLSPCQMGRQSSVGAAAGTLLGGVQAEAAVGVQGAQPAAPRVGPAASAPALGLVGKGEVPCSRHGPCGAGILLPFGPGMGTGEGVPVPGGAEEEAGAGTRQARAPVTPGSSVLLAGPAPTPGCPVLGHSVHPRPGLQPAAEATDGLVRTGGGGASLLPSEGARVCGIGGASLSWGSRRVREESSQQKWGAESRGHL